MRSKPLILIVACSLFPTGSLQASDSEPVWSGNGQYRILITLPSGHRKTIDRVDEQVAICRLELATWLGEQRLPGRIDLRSLQLHRFDSSNGKPLPGLRFASSRSPHDVPCRYEDDHLPDQYPSRVGRASETETGLARRTSRARKGRLFNREMDSSQGKLIWAHVENSQEDAHYALYFDLISTDNPWAVSPAPWIGDADVLRRETGQPLGGFSHFTAAVGDLNGDGLDDLVAGTEKGDLLWYPNRGSRDETRYLGCHILHDEEGPIDSGWYAAPFIYDWNDDGLLDLLVGTSGNVILWWENLGTKQQPEFKYRGFVTSDGQRLEVPEAPVNEDSTGIFKRDYYNQPWVGDYDGDGQADIITGGYTTGLIFWFQGVGRNRDGTPKLSLRGTLNTSGGPIDTVWAASPFLFDANSDGRVDLLTGGWWWSGIPYSPTAGEDDLLRYYRNLGASSDDLFERESFPRLGEFPRGQIARPMLIHWNGDELPDLLVSQSSGALYLALNVGTSGKPEWEMSSRQLTVPWGFTRNWDATAIQTDVNADGTPDLLLRNRVWIVGGEPRSPTRSLLGVAHVDGTPIDHEGPGYGDPYYYSKLHDWNGDGRADILWGTQQGNIYLHLQDGEDLLSFLPGELVQLTTGEALRVGPPVVDSPQEAADFTVLQGSRIVFAVTDFDHDGAQDLIVGDTYSQIWVFLGVGDGTKLVFRPGVLVAKLPSRPESICCADMNDDGKPDLIIGGTASDPGLMYANSSRRGRPAVQSAQSLGILPYLFWGPRLAVTDWNADGDEDLMVQSEFFSFWLEGSFLQDGYRKASVDDSQRGKIIQQKNSARTE